MKMIKLTLESGKPLYVNPLKINYVYQMSDHTAIQFETFYEMVLESAETAMKLINSELKNVQHTTD